MDTIGVESNVATWSDVAAASETAEERAAQLAMPPRRFDELLPCLLTDEEVAAKADELEAALAALDSILEEKKRVVGEFRARTQLAESLVREIREVRRTRTEMRSVEVVESFELRLGVARTTRTDTGEQIRERALRSSELQPSLPGTNLTQVQLDDAPLYHDGDEVDEPSEGDVTIIDDPEGVMADVDEAPAARVIRRRKRGA